MVYTAVLYGLLSFFISFFTIPFFCKLAVKLNIVDHPDGKIKVHEKTTPYLGGVAIFFAAAISMYCFGLFESQHYMHIMIGVAVLGCIGLIDDLYRIKPAEKFLGQSVAAFCFLLSGNCLRLPWMHPFIAYLITFFWFMTTINALNLVDIMDGLAGSISLCAALSFAVIGYYSNNSSLVIFLSSIIGSLLGFLYYNKPRAKIYLGDAGSLSLGGLLGVIPFMLDSHTQANNLKELFVGVIILGIPLLETALLIIIRAYKGIPFYMGSPDHFACYLRNKKWGNVKILCFMYILSVILCFVAKTFFFHDFSFIATFLQLFILLFFFVFVVYFNKASIKTL